MAGIVTPQKLGKYYKIRVFCYTLPCLGKSVVDHKLARHGAGGVPVLKDPMEL